MNFYARDGSEMTIEQWTALLDNLEYKRVAWTKLGDVVVSTVWLGIDHNWSGAGGPVIFETMVFGGSLQEQRRYSTEAEALDGHADVVELVRVEHQLAMPDAVVERPVREEES